MRADALSESKREKKKRPREKMERREDDSVSSSFFQSIVGEEGPKGMESVAGLFDGSSSTQR